MSGAAVGTFVLWLVVVAIVIAIVVWLLNWLYLRSSKERAFVRTGLGGQRVVLNGGAFVLQIVHEVIPVNMNTLRLEVARGRDKALITKDRMRVDVVSEFYVRVQAVEDAIAAAAVRVATRLPARYLGNSPGTRRARFCPVLHHPVQPLPCRAGLRLVAHRAVVADAAIQALRLRMWRQEKQ